GRRGRACCQDDVGLQADQLCRECSYPIDVTATPSKVHPHVTAVGPTQACKRLNERGEVSLRHGIVFVVRIEHADAPDALALLRPGHERPCRRRAAKERDELAAADHSITPSVTSSSSRRISRLSDLAVLRLMTSSYLVGCSTGRSAGFVPFKILPT